jgi:hypothetical protein
MIALTDDMELGLKNFGAERIAITVRAEEDFWAEFYFSGSLYRVNVENSERWYQYFVTLRRGQMQSEWHRPVYRLAVIHTANVPMRDGAKAIIGSILPVINPELAANLTLLDE